MSNDFNFNGKKDPFNKNPWNNVVDPVNNKEEKKETKIDISLLNDKDRAYYLAHGTLPKSQEEENISNRISESLSQFENKTVVKEEIPVQKEEVKENHQEIINQIVEDKTEETVVNQNLTNAFESMMTKEPNTQSTNVVTSWDDEPTVIDTNTSKETETIGDDTNTRKENETIDVQKATTTIPTPTMQKPELPSFANKLGIRNDDGIIDPVKQQMNQPNHENTNQKKIEVIDPFHEEQSKPMKPEEKVETEKVETKNEKENQNEQSPIFNKDPKEVLMTEQEINILDDKVVEEFNPIEDNTEKKSIDYGIVAPDVDNITVYNDLNKYVEENYDFGNDDSVTSFRKHMEDEETVLFKKNLLSGVATANRDLDQDTIADKDLNKMSAEIPDEIKSKNSNSKISANAIKNPDKIITGKQASMLINATVRGTKKVFLYNSGFWVIVRPLTNFELSEYINSIRNRDIDYGRTLGGHFYLYATLEIKRFFVEKLKSIIIDSNLQNWKQGDTLIENLSLQDFKTILWACACMMFKDGVEFTKICSFCNSVEHVSMNLSKLDFYNYDAIKDSAYPFIMNKKTMTVDDVKEYKNRINYSVPTFKIIDGWKYVLTVPSLASYMNFGDMFMNKLVDTVKDVNDSDKINNFVRYTHSKQYVPWISEIQRLDENNELVFKLADGPTIFENIDAIVQDNKDFFDYLESYIKATMLTYIAFPYIECPNCHKVPKNIMNGFVAYDIESAFFTMSVRKSQEISSQLKS